MGHSNPKNYCCSCIIFKYVQILHGTYLYWKNIYCLSAIQIYLDILYFYLLDLATISKRRCRVSIYCCRWRLIRIGHQKWKWREVDKWRNTLGWSKSVIPRHLEGRVHQLSSRSEPLISMPFKDTWLWVWLVPCNLSAGPGLIRPCPKWPVRCVLRQCHLSDPVPPSPKMPETWTLCIAVTNVCEGEI